MGWSNQNVIAQLVIIEGENDGLFVYNGAPALGNLIASIASAAGTDESGNAYLEGITTYFAAGGSTFDAINLLGNDLNFVQSTSGAGGPYTTNQVLVSGTSAVLGTKALDVVGNLDVGSNIVAETQAYSPGFTPVLSGTIETVHQITGGFPSGWSGTISYWRANDGVSPRTVIDFHITIANGTVVTNNEGLGVSLASGYFFATDNKFAFGQVNGTPLTGSQFAPIRISSTGALFYDGPAFTAGASNNFWYGGHDFATGV